MIRKDLHYIKTLANKINAKILGCAWEKFQIIFRNSQLPRQQIYHQKSYRIRDYGKPWSKYSTTTNPSTLILCPAKLSFISEGEIEIFQNEQIHRICHYLSSITNDISEYVTHRNWTGHHQERIWRSPSESTKKI